MSAISLAVCIPTYNNSEILRGFFEKSMSAYTGFGIDIYIYDSSDNEESITLTKCWQEQYGNLFYYRFPPKMHSNEKMYHIFQKTGWNKEYDYVWLCGDAIRCQENVLIQIFSKMNENYDMIIVDCLDFWRIEDKEYKDSQHMLTECAWYLTLYGAAVLNAKTMLTGVNWNYLSEKYLIPTRINFSHVGFYFEHIYENIPDFRAYHIGAKYGFGGTRKKKRSAWHKDIFFIWVSVWSEAILALPDFYEEKELVIRSHGVNSGIFSKKSILLLRNEKIYDYSVFKKYRKKWSLVTDMSRFDLFVISLMPPALAKCLYEWCVWMNKPTKLEEQKFLKLKDFCNKHTCIYIYGTGQVAERYARYLEKNHITYEGFFLSKVPEGFTSHRKHKVIQFDRFVPQNKEGLGIVLGMNQWNMDEVMPDILQAGYQVDDLFR